MEELAKISQLHTLSIVFWVLAVVFAVIAGLLFWKFRIVSILELRSGRGARKTIQKMEEINAKTGRLRQSEAFNEGPKLSGKSRVTNPVKDVTPSEKLKAGSRGFTGKLSGKEDFSRDRRHDPRQKASEIGTQTSKQAYQKTQIARADNAERAVSPGTMYEASVKALDKNTSPVSETETTVLDNTAETTVLTDGTETTVLNLSEPEKLPPRPRFEVTKKVLMIHTDEEITYSNK